jgi:hypothetical protein
MSCASAALPNLDTSSVQPVNRLLSQFEFEAASTAPLRALLSGKEWGIALLALEHCWHSRPRAW